jgi:hypothetical protein
MSKHGDEVDLDSAFDQQFLAPRARWLPTIPAVLRRRSPAP